MQRQAVLTTEGPLLLLAGAGSGKTTVLINRVANLLRYGRGSDSNEVADTVTQEDVHFLENLTYPCSEQDKSLADYLCAVEPAKPYSVLAITFTNKAANELKERLSLSIGPEAQDIWAMTFHSACCRILRREIEVLGYDRNFTIYDADDQKALMKDVLKQLQIDTKQMKEKAFLSLKRHFTAPLISCLTLPCAQTQVISAPSVRALPKAFFPSRNTTVFPKVFSLGLVMIPVIFPILPANALLEPQSGVFASFSTMLLTELLGILPHPSAFPSAWAVLQRLPH
jgi:hypothetical protein